MDVRSRGVRDALFTMAGAGLFAAVVVGVRNCGDPPERGGVATATKLPVIPVGTRFAILPAGVGDWGPVTLAIGDSEDLPKDVRRGEKAWACPPGTVVVVKGHLAYGMLHVEVSEGPLKGSPGFANPENVFPIADGVAPRGGSR